MALFCHLAVLSWLQINVMPSCRPKRNQMRGLPLWQVVLMQLLQCRAELRAGARWCPLELGRETYLRF